MFYLCYSYCISGVFLYLFSLLLTFVLNGDQVVENLSQYRTSLLFFLLLYLNLITDHLMKLGTSGLKLSCTGLPKLLNLNKTLHVMQVLLRLALKSGSCLWSLCDSLAQNILWTTGTTKDHINQYFELAVRMEM